MGTPQTTPRGVESPGRGADVLAMVETLSKTVVLQLVPLRQPRRGKHSSQRHALCWLPALGRSTKIRAERNNAKIVVAHPSKVTALQPLGKQRDRSQTSWMAGMECATSSSQEQSRVRCEGRIQVSDAFLQSLGRAKLYKTSRPLLGGPCYPLVCLTEACASTRFWAMIGAREGGCSSYRMRAGGI